MSHTSAAVVGQTPLRFWLTPRGDAAAILSWLESHAPGKYRIFYGHFISWCYAATSRSKTDKAGEMDRKVVAVLRKVPTETEQFVGLLEMCAASAKSSFGSSPGERDLNDRQKALFGQVFSRAEKATLVRSGADTAPFVDVVAMERREKKQKARNKKAKKEKKLAGGLAGLSLEDEDDDDNDLSGEVGGDDGGVGPTGGLGMQLALRPKMAAPGEGDGGEGEDSAKTLPLRRR